MTDVELLGLLLVLYFVPALVALSRGHNQILAISVLDLLLGWTLVGWVVALVWALTTNVKPTRRAVQNGDRVLDKVPEANLADQIQRYADMREQGVLTNEEFEELKAKLIGKDSV